MLRNIPIDPVVQQALDAHPAQPLAQGIKAWFFSVSELFVTFLLSLSPGWNIEVYVRVVYHSWFRRAINDMVHRRQEAEIVRRDEQARHERLRADEIKEDTREIPRESEGSEEWPDDGTIIRERQPREKNVEAQRQQEHDHPHHHHAQETMAEAGHEKVE